MPVLVGHKEKGAVHAEALAGGDGRHGYGEYFIQVQGGLQDDVEFMEKSDFPCLAVQETPHGEEADFLIGEFVNNVGKDVSERMIASPGAFADRF